MPQIYALDLAGGEAEALTSLPQGAGGFEISPDGKRLFFAALMAPPIEPSADLHPRISQPWYRFDPVPGYLQNVKQALFVMNTSGGKPKPVTAADGLILAGAWSPDSKQIAYIRTGLAGQEIFEADLHVVSLDRKPVDRKVHSGAQPGSITWSSDGQSLVYLASGTDLASQDAIFVMAAAGGKPVNRTTSLDTNMGTRIQGHNPARLPLRILTGDEGVLTTATIGGEANLVSVSLKGKKRFTPLTAGQRVCHLLDARAERVLFSSQHPLSPPALHLLDEASGEETVLTHHNDDWLAGHELPSLEHVVTRSERQVEVEGWVLVPRRGRKPHKTILMIHGGPHAGYGYMFAYDFLELVGAGYAVAFMNPRGSTGYGDDFSRSILGCWGEPELKDFNAFLDEIIRRGIAHPDKLGVSGISGGGHLSAWLIGHTHRFKAAVPEQGVYNMLSMWGTSDAGKVLIEKELGGPPHKIPLKYWQLSPLAHAHKCKTPTLLLQGEDDVRCPMEQAEQLFAALDHHGCDVEFIRMQKCNHGAQIGGRPQLRRYRMYQMIDWFDRYIR